MHGNRALGATHTFPEGVRRGGVNNSGAAKHPSPGSGRMDLANAGQNLNAGVPVNQRIEWDEAVQKGYNAAERMIRAR